MKKTVIALLVLAIVVTVAQGVYAQGGMQPSPPTRAYGSPGPGEGPAFLPMPRPVPPPMRGCTTMVLALPPPQMFEMHAEQLQITDEQKAGIREALGKAEKTLRPLRDESAQKAKALRDGLFTFGNGPLALRTLTDAAQNAETAIGNAELAAWNELRKILSAEQLKKLGEIMGGPGMMPPPPVPPRPSENTMPPPPPPTQ